MAGELHKGDGLREIANAAEARGSFSFDPDELRSLIRKWRELADDYADSVVRAESMATVIPPGNDFASEAHAVAANNSGGSYIAYLRRNAQYCNDQVDLFQAALDDYLGIEDTNATEFDKNDRRA